MSMAAFDFLSTEGGERKKESEERERERHEAAKKQEA